MSSLSRDIAYSYLRHVQYELENIRSPMLSNLHNITFLVEKGIPVIRTQEIITELIEIFERMITAFKE